MCEPVGTIPTGSNGMDDVRLQQHRGFGTRVQHALGRLAPRSWGGPRQRTDGVDSPGSSASKQRHQHRHSGDLELSARHSTSSVGTDAGDGTLPDPTATAADTSRPQTGSISHISSSGSLGAVTNDANSVASGSSALANRHLSTAHAAAGTHSSAAAGDDMCSVATQAGSASHSFTSLHSMMITHGDVSSDGGIPSYPAAAAAGSSDKAAAAGLSTSPIAGASSALSLLSTYRSSDAGGDATSVSTLPLISEAGYEERLLDVQTLTEEQDGELNRREVSSEGGPEPGSEHKGRISSSHGSYTSLASNASELSGLAPSAARLPSPAHTRLAHSQRSGSRHSFQQQLQQQLLLQDLEETQEEGGCINGGLPVPFSTRRRPDNDDMCSYATQAGSSVHSLSSVMSHLENTQPQRPQWSTDGNAALHTSGSNRSFSSLQPSRSRRSSAETAGVTAAASPAHFAGISSAASTATDLGSGPCSPSAGLRTAGPFEEAPSLQRKNSLKGALRAVSRWGSGISQRLQRVGSGGAQQHIPQPQQQSKRAGGTRNGSSPVAAAIDNGHELVAMRRTASQ